jgi:hypothetical protein
MVRETSPSRPGNYHSDTNSAQSDMTVCTATGKIDMDTAPVL